MKSGPEKLSKEDDLLTRFASLTINTSVQNQFISDLEDPFRYMGQWLSNKEHIHFSLTCHQIARWTELEKERRASSFLLEMVVQGNQEASMRILQSNPGLLLSTKGRAIDYSGKTIQDLTAFQAALCAGDLEMCEMMKPYFSTLECGLESLRKQYNCIFPQGIMEYSDRQQIAAFDFSQIIEAVLYATKNEVDTALKKQFNESMPLHQALNSFRNTFDKLSHNEQVFNPLHLCKVFHLFNEIYDDCSWNKRYLMWNQIVGYTQRHLPACYAQAFAQGIHQIIRKDENLQRTFEFRLGRDNDLGFNRAVDECPIRITVDLKPCPFLDSDNLSNFILIRNITLCEMFQADTFTPRGFAHNR